MKIFCYRCKQDYNDWEKHKHLSCTIVANEVVDVVNEQPAVVNEVDASVVNGKMNDRHVREKRNAYMRDYMRGYRQRGRV